MLRFLFDTDHLTLYYHRHPQLLPRMALQPPDAVGVSAVTAEETLRGRLAALSRARYGSQRIVRYRLLSESLDLVSQFLLESVPKAPLLRYSGGEGLGGGGENPAKNHPSPPTPLP
jgi:hypothetical protein